jgi:hypothetical protein
MALGLRSFNILYRPYGEINLVIALIDSDIIAYKIAFACKNETDFQQVAHSVDVHINDILRATECDDFECYLTGSKCFRREKYNDYKGQRKQEKPKWHSWIRKYLIEEYNAVVTDDGREADDHIIEFQRDELQFWGQRGFDNRSVKSCMSKYIAVSTDKDFNTACGWKYNPDKKVKYWVSEEDAELFFWSQMIMGDTVDNIKGIPGKGKMAAYKILSEAEDPKLAVIAAYKIAYPDEEEFKAMYQKNYECLYIGAECETQTDGEN